MKSPWAVNLHNAVTDLKVGLDWCSDPSKIVMTPVPRK